MSRTINALKWIGKLSGIFALIGFGVFLVIGASFFVLGANSTGISQAVMYRLLYGSGGLTLFGLTIWLVSRVAIWRSGSGQETIANPETETDQEKAEKTVEKDAGHYLAEFNKANRYVAMFFGFLLLISLSSSALTSAASGTPLGAVAGILVFGAKMLGGAIVHLLNTVWFAGSQYGIKNYQAKEAWIASILGWCLFTLSGLLMLSSSLGAIAIVAAGLKVLSYGWKSRGETRIKFTEEYIRGTELEEYLLE